MTVTVAGTEGEAGVNCWKAITVLMNRVPKRSRKTMVDVKMHSNVPSLTGLRCLLVGGAGLESRAEKEEEGVWHSSSEDESSPKLQTLSEEEEDVSHQRSFSWAVDII